MVQDKGYDWQQIPPRSVNRIWFLGASIVAATAILLCTRCMLWQSPLAPWVICSHEQLPAIYTVDETFPLSACIAVQGHTILGVGDYDDLIKLESFKPASIMRYLPQLPDWLLANILPSVQPRIYRLKEGSIIVPGLADAHAHIIENGYMQRLPLKAAVSARDAVARVRAYALAHPDIGRGANASQWIEGMGWDHTRWPGEAFPTADDLEADPILSGRLISLSRVDGHAKWVSRAVLELMGDLPETVNGGVIVRDAQGVPTGVLVDNAMDLIPSPPWSEELMAEFFELTIKEALSYGLTSIHDADTSPARIDFFRKLADAGNLPIRLYLMGYIESNKYWGAKIPRLLDYGAQKRLNLRSVKLFADGALGSWSAALLNPYADDTNSSGLLRYAPETLAELIRQFYHDGWQTAVHCIGDRANQLMLDIYEDILKNKTYPREVSSWRPRIEHAVMLTPEDLVRIGKLGVISSVQPTQATTDMTYAETRIGPERIKTSYAYQTLLSVSPNNILPLGSDFPVESVNPLFGFYAAVTRLSIDGSSPHGPSGWFSGERLTRTQALKGMTYDAAYSAFAEDNIGSLVRGKKADFVVLDQNIMTVPHEKILATKVLATVIDGEVAYGNLL